MGVKKAEEIGSVQQTPDGGYIIAGNTESFGAGDQDVYMIKTDAFGDTVWTRTFGGKELEQCASVQQTKDGDYIMVGLTDYRTPDYSDVYLIKTDTNGDTLWTRVYGGPRNDGCYRLRQTIDGGYLLVGLTKSFGAGDYDVYVVKADAHGDTIWTRTFGGKEMDLATSVGETSDGGYIIAGMTHSFGAGGSDVYLIRMDARGDSLWTSTCGGKGADFARSVRKTSDGGYIIAGNTESFGGGKGNVYLIRTEARATLPEEHD